MTDRNSHKQVAITETGVKEYTVYIVIGYLCLSDIMITDDNDQEIEIMTVPFSKFMFFELTKNSYCTHRFI